MWTTTFRCIHMIKIHFVYGLEKEQENKIKKKNLINFFLKIFVTNASRSFQINFEINNSKPYPWFIYFIWFFFFAGLVKMTNDHSATKSEYQYQGHNLLNIKICIITPRIRIWLTYMGWCRSDSRHPWFYVEPDRKNMHTVSLTSNHTNTMSCLGVDNTTQTK